MRVVSMKITFLMLYLIRRREWGEEAVYCGVVTYFCSLNENRLCWQRHCIGDKICARLAKAGEGGSFLTRCAQTGETVLRRSPLLRPADRLAPIKVSNTMIAVVAALSLPLPLLPLSVLTNSKPLKLLAS